MVEMERSLIDVPALIKALVLLAPLMLTPGVQAKAGEAAWIDVDGLDKPLSKVVTVLRKNVEIPYAHGLQACDKVRLVDTNAIVRIIMSDHTRLRLDSSRPEVQVPCERVGLSDTAARLFEAITGGAEARASKAAASRAAASKGPKKLQIPALVAEKAVVSNGDKTMVVTGERTLYLAWRDGVGPFAVELQHAGDGKIVVAQKEITGHSVTLPKTQIPVGQYTLLVKNADGSAVREDQFHVVAASELPVMPKELKTAKIDGAARTLFYADYLVGFEDGRFTMEALQQAASISPQTPASREWLQAWGQDD